MVYRVLPQLRVQVEEEKNKTQVFTFDCMSAKTYDNDPLPAK